MFSNLWIFRQKHISVLEKKFDFWPTHQFLNQITIFGETFGFYPQFLLFQQNWILRQKFRYFPKIDSTKISMFMPNFAFWAKFRLGPKVWFLNKWPILTKISRISVTWGLSKYLTCSALSLAAMVGSTKSGEIGLKVFPSPYIKINN